jgi:uncharacterized protein YukE
MEAADPVAARLAAVRVQMAALVLTWEGEAAEAEELRDYYNVGRAAVLNRCAQALRLLGEDGTDDH